MALFQMMASWRGKLTAEQLARQIAQSEWSKVWNRLSDQVWHMSRHERRGYIRARGTLVIQQAVEVSLRQHSPRFGSLAKVYSLTMDQVCHLVAEHMASGRPQVRSLRRVA